MLGFRSSEIMEMIEKIKVSHTRIELATHAIHLNILTLILYSVLHVLFDKRGNPVDKKMVEAGYNLIHVIKRRIAVVECSKA